MVELKEIFDVQYGHSLELNKQEICDGTNGIAFVSRKSGDNGISAFIKRISNIEPAPAGELTCALSGNGVLSTFIQEREYYTSYHVARLKPKVKLSRTELLYYCLCISKNRYKYSWGRQANRTLKNILIPSVTEIPIWVNEYAAETFESSEKPLNLSKNIILEPIGWKEFRYDEVFEICKGYYNKKPPTCDKTATAIPFIGATEYNNGITSYIEKETLGIYDKTGTITAKNFKLKLFKAKCITISNNGSVGEAFYQEHDFTCSHDVNPIYLLDKSVDFNKFIAMFLATLIRAEKYRWGYGRKWRPVRMPSSVINLPVDSNNKPDWAYMEEFIKTIKFSSTI
ncbi:restriction endonuclease subunit S [Flavobacterium johnsoniae]|uniref:Type I restriction modification DNA specificity domain-containing protein n=1 Tax=Flavobacterium johnsoniae TaxID=986 RepID=A0A1J7CGK9_FLAJO|nr:restriction endonuclease subunit S [Flavobacterium johnsoniae]OIV40668.1 hypothetical protein BKM63_17560 [Flavobacterium johnsoniae]